MNFAEFFKTQLAFDKIRQKKKNKFKKSPIQKLMKPSNIATGGGAFKDVNLSGTNVQDTAHGSGQSYSMKG